MPKTMDYFNKYIIKDGLHPVVQEEQAFEEATGLTFPRPDDADEPATHRIYKFPNGFGASIIKGWMSLGKYEIMIVEFDEYDSHYIMGDYIRCEKYDELLQYLIVIYNLGETVSIESDIFSIEKKS